MLNYDDPKLDIETWRQLVNIKLNSFKFPDYLDPNETLKTLTEIKQNISNLALRIKLIEDLKLIQEIEILTAQAKINKKLIDEINKERLDKEYKKDMDFVKEISQQYLELRKRIEDLDIKLVVKPAKSIFKRIGL